MGIKETFTIANWYKGHQAPAVLMIDDLSDAYIELYQQSYKNDWGYLCDKEGSAFDFLEQNLLKNYPHIKITFFVPYLKHNVIHPKGPKYKKYSIGERKEFTNFLEKLTKRGFEIAHHGSNHGRYKHFDPPINSQENFLHEWELFEDIASGVLTTKEGVERFKKYKIAISGGKFCGYKSRENSLEIIDKCNFDYWCVDSSISKREYRLKTFGENNIIEFPTIFSGNAFVRLSYKTNNRKKDFIKLFTKLLQPIYNIKEYKFLEELYREGKIISIQEHISPATSSTITQSANIISDIKSLNKIFKFLSTKDIWYATCAEISRYIHIKNSCSLSQEHNRLSIEYNNTKAYKDSTISILSRKDCILVDENNTQYTPYPKRDHYIFTLPLKDGINRFTIKE